MTFRLYLRRAFLLPVFFYRHAISPMLPPSCRFVPTCSAYMVEAVETHGIVKGSWLAMKRIGKCHPLCKGHVYDPVPPRTATQTKDRLERLEENEKIVKTSESKSNY